jgi:hypothetical protein
LRSSLANAAMAVEDRVVWGAADLLRGVADAVRWPFQRIGWAVERFFVWPLQEETALWSRGTQAAVLAAVVALAGGAVAAGIVLSNPSGEADKVNTLGGPAAPALAGSAHHKAAVTPTGPSLHGTAPNFAPEAGEGVPKSAESEVLRSEAGAKGAVAGTDTKAGTAEGSAAGAQSNAPTIAGPAAIKVAHRFAEAFVLYEIGRASPGVKATIAATTSPDLTKALLRRPPRLPSNVKVPKARVLNIVPGPTNGGTYTLSASLLRVGVTSELRMDMKRGKDGAWQVTDVTG